MKISQVKEEERKEAEQREEEQVHSEGFWVGWSLNLLAGEDVWISVDPTMAHAVMETPRLGAPPS